MQKLYKTSLRAVTMPTYKAVCGRWLLVLIYLLSSWVLQANAQQVSKKRITGKVVTGQDYQAIPGANVLVKGTSTGTTANDKGEFVLDVASNAILVISSVGYQSQELKVNGRSKLVVTLQEDVATLNEVVVVGYGEMKRTDLSSAQVSISANEIKRTVNTTIDQALQGRAANVYVTSNTGKPGGGVSVNIRGISTISGNTEPMYVIDGVQIIPSTSSVSSNALAGINPDDVESLQILQGPSAQSIYGSRAANGVVVITTKKGKAGETKISYNGLYSVQQLPKLLSTMNLQDYAIYQNTVSQVLGQTPIAEFADPSLLGEGTNWQKELFQVAPMQKHQITLSGGNERTTFYFSTEYLKQDGIAIQSGFERYGLRLNLENKVRNWLKLGSNLSFSGSNEKLSITNDDLINTALSQSPAVAVRNADGTFDGPSQTQFRLSNPVALASINDNRYRRLMGLGTFYTEINLLKDLVFRTELNGNIEFGNTYQYYPSYKFGGFVNTTTTSNRGSSTSIYYNLNQLLRYNHRFGKHDLGMMVSHEAQHSSYESLSGSRQGFISNNVQELSNGDAKTATNNSAKSAWAMESYFGRLNYSFNDKYILQATLRADGSSVFGANNRWGYFPSVSGAWRVSKESFMKELHFIDDLKIRAEYGITGNQNSPGLAIYSAMQPWATPWGTGFLTANFSNPDFKWEETKTYNVGFDLHAFKNRLEIIFDAYFRNTDNLILGLPLPNYLGASGNGSISSPIVNLGAMENNGFGVTVNTVNLEGTLGWRSGLTFSLDRNQLTKLYIESSIVDRSPWFMNQFIARSVIGQPVWQFYAYQQEGLFKTIDEVKNSAIPENNVINAQQGTWVGDFKFSDLNGDGVINEKDRTFIGSPWPKFSFGVSNSFSYKNFDLSIFVNGVYGNSIFNYTRYVNTNPNGSGPGRGFFKEVANFARVSSNVMADNPRVLNADATVPRIIPADPNGNNRPTNRYIEDGSYIRVKNIQLAYTLPKQLLKNIPVKSLRLTAGVQNAFTFTNYTGYDPEVGTYTGNGSTMVGVDYGRYPSARMYSFSLSADF